MVVVVVGVHEHIGNKMKTKSARYIYCKSLYTSKVRMSINNPFSVYISRGKVNALTANSRRLYKQKLS